MNRNLFKTLAIIFALTAALFGLFALHLSSVTLGIVAGVYAVGAAVCGLIWSA